VELVFNGFEASGEYVGVIVLDTYSGGFTDEGFARAELWEISLHAQLPVPPPPVRGEWDVSATGLSKMHRSARAAEYTVVLDSEPLAEVVVVPIVVVDTPLPSTSTASATTASSSRTRMSLPRGLVASDIADTIVGASDGTPSDINSTLLGKDAGLVVWGMGNATLHTESRARVVTGRYHWGIRSVQIATALHFNASTWNTPQTLSIAAVDDNEQGINNRTVHIRHLLLSEAEGAVMFETQRHTSSGASAGVDTTSSVMSRQYRYNGTGEYHTVNGKHTAWPHAVDVARAIVGGRVPVKVSEDDAAGVTVHLPGSTLHRRNGEVAIVEGGRTSSFDIVLDSEPRAAVTVTVSSPHAAEDGANDGANDGTNDGTSTVNAQLYIRPRVHVFDAANWSTKREVLLEAFDDRVFEGSLSFAEVCIITC
jgi:hypothetical protein